MDTPAFTLQIDAPLDIHYDNATKALTLTCYQFVSDGSGVKMNLQLTPQATQEMFRALSVLQNQFGISSEQLATPHSVQ